MSKEKHPVNCKNCNIVVEDPFCSKCGRPVQLKRIDASYILSEIGSILNLDRGILYSVKELLIRPGISIHKFIHEDRNRLVKPIIFIILTSLIYTILQQWLKFEDGYVNYSFGEESTLTYIFGWVTQNYGYSNLLMAIFIALWIKVFYRKYGYNYFEILILLCFLMGMGMLIFSIFGILDSLLPFKIIDKGFLIGILYISWGIARFFDKRKIMNYFKAFLSYMIGMISFTFIVVLIGIFIDLIKN